MDISKDPEHCRLAPRPVSGPSVDFGAPGAPRRAGRGACVRGGGRGVSSRTGNQRSQGLGRRAVYMLGFLLLLLIYSRNSQDGGQLINFLKPGLAGFKCSGLGTPLLSPCRSSRREVETACACVRVSVSVHALAWTNGWAHPRIAAPASWV